MFSYSPLDCDLRTGLCPDCGKRGKTTAKRNCAAKINRPVPTTGPGTELEGLIKLLGKSINQSCECGRIRDWMNLWGVEGCRANLEFIVGHLESQKQLQSLWTLAAAAALAVRHGLPPSVRGLVEEAIKRAELPA